MPGCKATGHYSHSVYSVYYVPGSAQGRTSLLQLNDSHRSDIVAKELSNFWLKYWRFKMGKHGDGGKNLSSYDCEILINIEEG